MHDSNSFFSLSRLLQHLALPRSCQLGRGKVELPPMDPLTRKVSIVSHRSRRKPLSEEIQQIYRLLSATLILMILGSTVGLLGINSQRAAKGYTLQQLQLTYETLSSDKRNIEHQLTEAQSINSMDAENPMIKEMTFLENSALTYIDEDSSLAQN